MHNQAVVCGTYMFKFFKKRSKGVTVLETAITLPIFLYIVFFSIELVRIGLAQTAVDAITKECTFSLMATGKVSNFDGIFAKYKPFGIPIGNFRYYIRLYSSIETMMGYSPYGGETIGWAGTDYTTPSATQQPTAKAQSFSYGLTSSHAILSKYQTSYCNSSSYGEVGDSTRKSYLDSTVPSGYTFVLTVAVKFPFSSPFVAKLFSGGKNTNRANVFILWARGSGMVN